MDSPFMETIATGVAKTGIRVARFEFPYMRRRREAGAGGAPDPEAVLMQPWRETIEKLGGGQRPVIGGKSLGGRVTHMQESGLPSAEVDSIREGNATTLLNLRRQAMGRSSHQDATYPR